MIKKDTGYITNTITHFHKMIPSIKTKQSETLKIVLTYLFDFKKNAGTKYYNTQHLSTN